jgi:tetratricopeptide (TPR) repeat protein/transcriptional regulator with XRE-family HTH domain
VFGQVVRGHRERCGLTQQELADTSRLSVRSVGKIEAGHGTPRPVTVRLLADAFGLVGLERDRFFAAARAQAPALPTGASGPAQLPLDVRGFVGRRAELQRLDAILDTVGRGNSMAVAAVSGTAGVGKTALAVHWSHRVQDRFDDGQLYVNLRGFDPVGPVVAPQDAIRRFLDALRIPPHAIPTDLDAQAALYRTLVADKRMLIVLDNARDPDQVRPLLPGAPGCLVLITSRSRLAGLVATEGVHPVPLGQLAVDEARSMLTQRLGDAKVAAEPAEVDQIITRCARLPLALAIVAANAATQPELPLAVLADQLRQSQHRMDALSTHDNPSTDVRAVFTWSVQALSPAAARLFRLLGLHPGPDTSAPAAASLAAGAVTEVLPLLRELAGAHLVHEHRPGRYTFHDLLRAYAAELTRATDTEALRTAATRRLLDHYLHTAYAANRILHPGRDPIALPTPEPGTLPEQAATHEQARDWFTAERAVLLAAVEDASGSGFDTHAWRLVWTLNDFLYRTGDWQHYLSTWETAVAATRRLPDLTARATAHWHLAMAYNLFARVDEATTHLRHALALYTETGDKAGQAHVHHVIANGLAEQSRRADALYHAQQALELYEAADHQVGRARALNSVGWYHAELGDHRQALACCQRALSLLQDLGDIAGQASTWDSLGYTHHHLGDHPSAVDCYQQALTLFHRLGNRHLQAVTLTRLAETHNAAGDREAARRAWQQALDIYSDIGHPAAANLRAKLRDESTVRDARSG